MVTFTRLVFAVAALVGLVSADLKVVSPGGPNLWWVAKSQNVIVWTCNGSPYSQYTVLIANSDPKVLVSPLAIVAIAQNYDCSLTITQDQANQAPGTGYTIQLANILNSTDVYAESAPFEIKSLGSAYPDPSATPTSGGTFTGSVASPSATNATKANSAIGTVAVADYGRSLVVGISALLGAAAVVLL